jgi:glucokinase
LNEAIYLGIEIGGTKLQLALGDGRGVILDRRRYKVSKERGGAGIREQIAKGLPELAGRRKIHGMGVGFGGPVDWRSGRIQRSHQIEGWSHFELGAWLGELASAPVQIDNDANVACLGEALKGAGEGFNPVFYVTLGSGVGGGLVLDGRVFHGAIPGESEIGHIRLDKSGRILEQNCSGWAVDQKIREAVRKDPASLLNDLIHNAAGGEARFLGPALERGDALARKILDETADDLAFGLSHVAHLMHPAVIVLGGGLSLLGEPLRAATQARLSPYVMEAFHPAPEIRIARLGEDAVPVGALLLASIGSATD